MKTILIIIGLIFSLNVFTQDITKNNVFAELSGATGVYSVNYERLLRNKKNINFAFRIGFSYLSDNEFYTSRFIFPLSFSVLKNISKNHFLEIRVSQSGGFYTYKDWSAYGLGDTTGTFKPETKIGYDMVMGIGVGYRYQPISDGIFFNLLLQKIVYFSNKNWYGNISLGIGYAF